MKTITDAAALARLVGRLQALTPDSQRRWGTLEPGEMLCHLGDAAASVLGRPGGSPARRRRLLKWVGLRSNLPWPRGRPTLARIDPRREGTRPTDFEADRRRAIEGLHALAAAPPEALPSAHFVFGAMDQEDWRRWAWRHTDHHLRQFGL